MSDSVPARDARLATVALTGAALVAFAANSILCRLALAEGAIDAAAFTAIRLLAGAVVLAPLLFAARRGIAWRDGFVSGAWLFAYAAAFSYAYDALGAATGALLLFGVVQLAMLAVQWRRRALASRTIVGALVAFAGLVVLVAPGVTAPPAAAAALMMLAGLAWAAYSLRGGGADPATRTAINFAATLPLAGVLVALDGGGRASAIGVVLAVVSGALTSGLGYVAWYAALRRIDASQAAVVQLAVPVVAAVAAVALLDEPVTPRLVAGGTVVVIGIAFALGVGARAR